MIVRCGANDRDGVLSYIGTDYGKCLYLYLDLLEFGFDSPYVSVWKDEPDGGGMAALALVYHATAHLFTRGGAVDRSGWARLLGQLGVSLVCAEESVVRSLEGEMRGRAEYGSVGRLAGVPEDPDRAGIRRAAAADFEVIAQLLHRYAHYDRKADLATVERQLRSRWESGFTRNYVLESDGAIVAHVCTQAEGPGVAVAGGFVTDPRYRRRGLAARLFKAVAFDLAAEGKDVFTFSYDEAARRFNMGLGLLPCCGWGRMFCGGEGRG